MQHPVIDDLIQFSLESKHNQLGWIPYEDITKMELTMSTGTSQLYRGDNGFTTWK